MECPNCKKEIDNSSAFCNFCGCRIADNKQEQDRVSEQISVETAPVIDEKNVKTKRIAALLLKIGRIVGIIGVAGFLTIVLVGLIVYGTVYFFNGYDITKVLCIIDIVLMLSGAIGASVGLVLSWKNSSVTKTKKLITVIIAALAVTFSTILIINGIKEAKPKYDTSSSYEMSHSTYCLVYMKVSDVQVRHSGNYAYILGTITNNGTYQIKYVKVRAVCKDAYGSIVDTDWTYAVDSDWLNSGESKKFEMMVSDRSDSIKTANVTVVMD